MKTIQITIDEKLLAKLDADEETQRDGRSAVLRRAVGEYLKNGGVPQYARAIVKPMPAMVDWVRSSKVGRMRAYGRANSARTNLAVRLFAA